MRNNTAASVENFRVPSKEQYDPAVSKALKRRSNYSILEDRHIVSHSYCIDGMTYHVNSIFETAGKKTVIDDVKHLIDGELSKVS